MQENCCKQHKRISFNPTFPWYLWDPLRMFLYSCTWCPCAHAAALVLSAAVDGSGLNNEIIHGKSRFQRDGTHLVCARKAEHWKYFKTSCRIITLVLMFWNTYYWFFFFYLCLLGIMLLHVSFHLSLKIVEPGVEISKGGHTSHFCSEQGKYTDWCCIKECNVSSTCASKNPQKKAPDLPLS